MRKRLNKLWLLVVVVAYALVNFTTAFAVERVYILPSTAQEKTPKSYLFQLKGSSEKYILLDNTDEGYFVMTQKNYAQKTFSVDGNPVAFDPEDPNSIAYWLNNDFLYNEDVEKRLPDVIIENLVERVYTTEGGGSLVPFSSAYDVKCKVVLLSQTEWSTYNAKFGFGDDTTSAAWLLRSVRERSGTPLVAYTSGSNGGLTHEGKWTSSLGIRPAFYLSKDFFEKASVNVENTGDAVMALIRQEYETPALNQMYSSSELYTLTQADIAPMADAVTVTGRGIVGENIVGKYSFVSLDANEEDGTMIQWQRSKDGEVWSTILGAEKIEYAPTVDDVGCFIRMKVSPMTGTMAGASYTSMALGCTIRPISKPVASNVRIQADGQVKPGTMLGVKYSYYDENRDLCSETDYVWESSVDMVSAEKIGDTRYLKLSNSEGGKYVRVGVTPKKKTNSATGRETVTGDMVYSEWIAVENLPMASNLNVTRSADISLTVSKTEDGVSVKTVATPVGSKEIEKLTAEYSVDRNNAYTVVCEWQGSDSENGAYAHISTGDSLNYVPSKTTWVRAKVYTKNSENRSKEILSQPIYIGKDKEVPEKGDVTLSQNLIAGKTYEIWISSDVATSYAYSFGIEGVDAASVSSDKYFISTMQSSEKTYIMGTLILGEYNGDAYIKAGEITPATDAKITISDVMTATLQNNEDLVSQARVFIIEK